MPTDLGLWDTWDRCWLGNAEGPLTYTDPQLARVAAEVVSVMLRWQVNRVEARPVDPNANRLRDHVVVQRSCEDALQLLEEGRI